MKGKYLYEKLGIDHQSMQDMEEYMLDLKRTVKVVKGGRRFRFAALMIVGNKNGIVGIGYGKANEVPEAIRKGVEDAKKNLVRINLKKGDTIAHEIKAKFCSSEVWMKPASTGTGIIAGGNIRAVLEYAGIKNVLTKTYRSRNKINAAKAAFKCLTFLIDPADIAEKRNIKIDQVFQ